MSGPASSLPSHVPLLEQAALWFDRLSGSALSVAEQQEFDAWRDHPDHRLAFAEVEAAHAEARRAADQPEMLALRHEALSRIVLSHKGRRQRRAWTAGAVAASMAVAAVGITWTGTGPMQEHRPARLADASPSLYRTAVGEQLTVNLADGSSVTLNTASRLRVAYGSGARRLILEQGQAFFRVAKGDRRPFVVQALDRAVTARGTSFDVRIEAGRRVRVALVEGIVDVALPASAGGTPVRMRPSDVLVTSAGETRVSRAAEIEQQLSWRDGLIILEDESLAEATAEVNRYVRTPIVLDDEKLRRLRVSGAFRTGETGAFVEALELSFPVRVVSRSKERIVLASRD